MTAKETFDHLFKHRERDWSVDSKDKHSLVFCLHVPNTGRTLFGILRRGTQGREEPVCAADDEVLFPHARLIGEPFEL